MQSPELIFVIGVTASGKTGYALDTAERLGGDILSCDSLCVYRGMDIGTAKPTASEQLRVPHYGLDLSDPWTTYSVGDYIQYRDALLREKRGAGRPVVVCGGSGFYLKSFFAPVVDQLKIPERVEREVGALYESGGLEEVCIALRDEHPQGERFEGLDWNNPRRVVRALIRTRASGQTYSQLREAFLNQEPPLQDWAKRIILLSRSDQEMDCRNRTRVKAMLAEGFVDEVRQLQAQGFEQNPMASGSIGYAEVLQFLNGELDEPGLEERIVIRTNQLMRKQRNWFRHHIPEPECLDLTGL